ETPRKNRLALFSYFSASRLGTRAAGTSGGCFRTEFPGPKPPFSITRFNTTRCGLAFACILMAFSLSSQGPETASNLVANPDLEDLADHNHPAHWEPFVVSVPGTFAIDEAEKHSGKQSVRIDAPENTRLYLRSEPIAVAPGERISASAWVKCKDVPPG